MWFSRPRRPYKALCLQFWALGWPWLHIQCPRELASLPGAQDWQRGRCWGSGRKHNWAVWSQRSYQAGGSLAPGWGTGAGEQGSDQTVTCCSEPELARTEEEPG